MARSIALVSKVAALRPAPFETPIDWYSNGERGHLHHSQHCDKVTRSSTSTVTRSLRLRDALARTVCGECLGLGGWTDTQRGVLSAASTLERIEGQLSGPSHNPIHGVGMEPVDAVRRRVYFLRMREVLGQTEIGEHLTAWRDELLETAVRLTPENPPFEEVESAVLRHVATATFWKHLSRDDGGNPTWGGRTVTDVLGQPAWSDWNNPRSAGASIATIGRAWIEHVNSGRTPTEARELLIGTPDALTPHLAEPDWALLRSCSELETPDPGENLAAYAMRIWHDRARTAAATLLTGWERRIAELVKPATKVVIAREGYGPDELPGLICGNDAGLLIGALQETVAVRSSRNGKFAVICHPTIADYLVNIHGRSGWSEVQPLPEENHRETLETALALWDSWDREGSYSTFGKALEAANHI